MRTSVSTLRRLVLLLAGLALAAGGTLAAVERMPQVRLPLATTILEPFDPPRQISVLRRWALDCLVDDPSAEARLELLRLVNTVDAERFPEVAADVDAAAARLAGLSPTVESDRSVQIRAVNEWAAARLGRRLDANGGVMGWLPIRERFVQPIDAIAGTDLNAAWVTWCHFAAGDLVSSEQFLYAVGPALGDPRPIHFAIWRSGNSFDGQPVPIDSRTDVLARTVGEALALQFWQKEGVGSSVFPEDFGAWWARWSRQRRLPPLPAGGSAAGAR